MAQEKLIALKCQDCGELFIPPKYLCSKCGSGKLAEARLSGEGEVYTYTTIRVAPLEFQAQAPYDVVIVKLKEGLNVTGRLQGEQGAALQIGAPVSFIKKEGAVPWFRVK